MSAAAFYCVADERFFLGAVGMINSLRLVGHGEPVYVLDCGLTLAQRERLSAEAVVVPGPADSPPWLLKTIAPLAHPAEVAVLIDADMIATRSLLPLIEQAAGGRVIAFENYADRFCPDWSDLLDLGPLRRRPYVSSGLVALGGEERGRVLELLDDRQRRVDIELGFYGRKVAGYPFTYPEQDVLNAILMSQEGPDRVTRLGNELAPNPPFRGLRLRDPATLRCSFRDGTEPYVVHHFVRKPWLEPTYTSVYSRLLSRLLLAADGAIRVPDTDVPLWLRRGPRARWARAWASAKDLPRWHLGDRLPAPIGTRIEAARRRRRARDR
ncbi:MAG TPA: hypothetical protein VFY99_03280 [Solirubrobacterales bacterium]